MDNDFDDELTNADTGDITAWLFESTCHPYDVALFVFNYFC